MSHGGFTLVELIACIAIIAVLAGICVPCYTHYRARARFAADEAAMTALYRAAAAEAALRGDSVILVTCYFDGRVEVTGKRGQFDLPDVGVIFQSSLVSRPDENGSLPCALTLSADGVIHPFYEDVTEADRETETEENAEKPEIPALFRTIYRQAASEIGGLPVELHIIVEGGEIVGLTYNAEADGYMSYMQRPVDIEDGHYVMTSLDEMQKHTD